MRSSPRHGQGICTEHIDRALRLVFALDAGNTGVIGAGAPAGWAVRRMA